MKYPLVRELAADGIPVTVTCRVLKIARQPFYRWLAEPVTQAEWDQAHLVNALGYLVGASPGSLLAELGPVATYHPLPITVAYHDACHLGHAQGIRNQPRELLRAVPELSVKEIKDASICCGSAGIYNVLNPEPAKQLGDAKAANVIATGAQLLVTANPGCIMQIAQGVERAGGRIGTAHIVTVLDHSQRGLPADGLLK